MTALSKLNSFEWIVCVGRSTYWVLKRDKIIESAREFVEVGEDVTPEQFYGSVFVSILAISIKAESDTNIDDNDMTVLGLSDDGKGEQLGPDFANEVFNELPHELKHIVSIAVTTKSNHFEGLIGEGVKA